ncbi:MAG: ABC transporter permease [Patescibacteria group bacterium]
MYKLLENIKLALQSVWSKKVRSLLTMLGVIIGVFAIVILIGLGEGLKQDLKKEVESIGANLLIIVPGKLSTGSMPTGMVGSSTLTTEDVESIQARQHIVSVTPIMILAQPVSYNGQTVPNALPYATTPNIQETFLKLGKSDILRGRQITDEDYRLRSHVAVLMNGVKKALFGDQDAVGKFISIGSQQFEVIGWYDSEVTASVIEGPELTQIVALPLTVAEEVFGPVQVHRIIATVDDSDNIETEKVGVTSALMANHGNVENFTVMTQDDFLELITSILNIVTNMLAGIAAISLLVGGIGVMNIMLVSVTERTREVGLRKAVGASNVDILVQFLVEAIFLSSFGGAIGIGLAFIGSAILEAQIGFAPSLTVGSIIMAFCFTAVVGIFFGVAPAIRAARLNPIDALKYE